MSHRLPPGSCLMPKQHHFRQMLAALAALFAAENRPGGTEVAMAVSGALLGPLNLRKTRNPQLSGLAETVLASSPHPVARLIVPALPYVHWHFAGLDDGRIRPDIAKRMLTAELIGPDGVIFDATVRMGLFLQAPGLSYVTRMHAAEETFVMLGGRGWWSTNDRRALARGAGAVIHHPSMTPHASRTRQDPLLAAWRWTGDIGWDGYKLTG